MQDIRLSDFLKYFLIFSILIISSSVSPLNANTNPPFTIVIDAGHGGKDIGSKGQYLTEKDATLLLVLELGKVLERSDEHVKVVYTRESDVFLPVHRRVGMANEINADLFISMHCNAINNKNPHGIETYVLGIQGTKENLEVAKRENQAILHEDDFQQQYNGFDPNSPTGHIILSTVQNKYMNEGIEIAHEIQKQFADQAIMKNRGVKQASFVVLRKATMPAILIEAGFLSNKNDEKKIKAEASRRTIVNKMSLGIIAYVQSQINTTRNTSPIAVAAQSDNTILAKAHQGSSRRTTTISDSYRIIVGSSKNGPLADLEDKKLLHKIVRKEVSSGQHTYFIGPYSSLTEAINAQNDARSEGYRGAYVTKQEIGTNSTADVQIKYDGLSQSTLY